MKRTIKKRINMGSRISKAESKLNQRTEHIITRENNNVNFIRSQKSNVGIFYDILVDEYPIDYYRKMLNQNIVIDKEIKILVLISNYMRRDMLENLLKEIRSYKKTNIIIDYVIFDDVSDYKLDDPNFIINDKHRGKFQYWKTFDEMFKYCKNNIYDIYLFSPNDFMNNNCDQIIKYGNILKNEKYVFNTLNDGREMCWNKTKPINLDDDIDLIFFSDCGFFTNQKTLEMLEYRMDEIVTINNNLSSQVGKSITNRLNQLRIPIFHPKISFVYHGIHDSLMNPTTRKTNKLVSNINKI